MAADVAHQTAKAHAAGAAPEEARPSRALAAHPHATLELNAPQVQRVATQTATFQLLASILAPFVVIHTSVDLAKKALKSAPAALARHGPTVVGLACIPLLPLVDHPIEHGAPRCGGRGGACAPSDAAESRPPQPLRVCSTASGRAPAAQRKTRSTPDAAGPALHIARIMLSRRLSESQSVDQRCTTLCAPPPPLVFAIMRPLLGVT